MRSSNDLKWSLLGASVALFSLLGPSIADAVTYPYWDFEGPHEKNVEVVAYNDLQARRSYMPQVVKQIDPKTKHTRYILYVAHHWQDNNASGGGTSADPDGLSHPWVTNPLTGKVEPNGTSIIDVTHPWRPHYLAHIPAGAMEGGVWIQYGKPDDEGRHVRVCAGSDLPGAKYPGRYFMIRTTGQASHDIFDVTDPANPIPINIRGEGHNHVAGAAPLYTQNNQGGIGNIGITNGYVWVNDVNLGHYKQAALTYTHKQSWDCASGYVAMPASPPGSACTRNVNGCIGPSTFTFVDQNGVTQHMWRNYVTKIFDLSDPYNPKFIRDYGVVGQEPGSTITPIPSFNHEAIISNGRMYSAYGVSANGILQINDLTKLVTAPSGTTLPIAPTPANLAIPVLGQITTAPEWGGHTLWPIINKPMPNFRQNGQGYPTQQFAIWTSEYTSNHCSANQGAIWMVDQNDPTKPQPISTFQVPAFERDDWRTIDWCSNPGRFGPHDVAEEWVAPWFYRVVPLAYFGGGVRFIDYRDPFHMKQIAFFVPHPNANTQENCYTDSSGSLQCGRATQTNNVAVDDRGYTYTVDRAGSGAWVLALTGEAREILYGDE